MFSRLSEYVPRPRTPAQREASRRNGRMSRGPRTLAGKRQSCQNALKHGLFARMVRPPGDYRQLDVAYDQIRRQLIQEFAPRTFSDRLRVDALAHDYVQLCTARQIANASLPVRSLSPREAESWARLQRAESDLRLIRHTLGRLQGTGPLLLATAKARRLADCLVALLQAVEQDLAEADDPEFDPLTPYEIELREPQDLLIKALGRVRQRLTHRSHLEGLLAGKQELSRQQRKHLIALLAYAEHVKQSWISKQEHLRDTIERVKQDNLAAAARALPSLALADDYQAKIQRRIDRQLHLLRER